MTSTAAIRHAAPTTRADQLVLAADVAAKVLFVALLAHASLHPDLPQYAENAMGYRLVSYPLALLAVPVVYVLRGGRGRYPYVLDLCLVAPFLLDTAGNAGNLYDRVEWWDDAMHVATWVPLVVAFGLAVRPRLGGAGPWVLVGLVVGFGAVASVLWEVAEYVSFVADHPVESLSAYRDTVGDMVGSLTGSVLGASLLVCLARRRGRWSEWTA